MSIPVFWADGQVLDALALPSRAADFGDGIFETLRVHQGRALLLDYHLDRAALGAQRLALNISRAQLAKELAAAIAACKFEHAALRMNIARAASARGYRFDPDLAPLIWFSFTALMDDGRQMQAPAQLDIASYRLSTQPKLAGIKHMNRLDQVLASAEAQALGADELLLCDQSGTPVAVIAGNLFALSPEGQWQTPPVDDAGVAGTVRRFLLASTAARERVLSLEDISKAQELFFCNSVVGLRPVARLGQQHWQQWRHTRKLFDHYTAQVLL